MRRAPAQHLAQFLTKFLFNFGMLAEQVPRPGKRNRRGLVPGQQESQDFVTQLAVGHAAAIFVAGRHQHGEQVAGVLSAGATVTNDAVHNFIELADRTLHPNHRRVQEHGA